MTPRNGCLSKQLKENKRTPSQQRDSGVRYALENIPALLFQRIRSPCRCADNVRRTRYIGQLVFISLGKRRELVSNLYPCYRWNSWLRLGLNGEKGSKKKRERERRKRRRRKKNRNGVTRWNFGRVHLILNLYRRRESRHYTPPFGLFHVPRRAASNETNASKRAWLVFPLSASELPSESSRDDSGTYTYGHVGT